MTLLVKNLHLVVFNLVQLYRIWKGNCATSFREIEHQQEEQEYHLGRQLHQEHHLTVLTCKLWKRPLLAVKPNGRKL